MCSGVCSADLLSAKNKLTDAARKAPIFSDPICPSANSESPNHRTSWRSLVQPSAQSRLRASAGRSGLCPVDNAVSTRMEIHDLSGAVFQYLTTLAGFLLPPYIKEF